MKASDRDYQLWWETDDGRGDELWHLIALVPPDFPTDSNTTAKLSDALNQTTRLCGGWKAVYTKMKEPALPWHSDMDSTALARIWSTLLREFALRNGNK